MKNTIGIFTSFLMLVLPTLAYADKPTKLYKGYEFGMSKTEIMKTPKVYDCTEEFEKGALCLDEQKFTGEEIDIGFRFVDEKLVSVILFSEFTEENYLQFIGAIGSKFQLTTIESDNK